MKKSVVLVSKLPDQETRKSQSAENGWSRVYTEHTDEQPPVASVRARARALNEISTAFS